MKSIEWKKAQTCHCDLEFACFINLQWLDVIRRGKNLWKIFSNISNYVHWKLGLWLIDVGWSFLFQIWLLLTHASITCISVNFSFSKERILQFRFNLPTQPSTIQHYTFPKQQFSFRHAYLIIFSITVFIIFYEIFITISAFKKFNFNFLQNF